MIGNSGGNNPIIPVLTGPTASGKTSIALALAEKYPQIEIISADSRQIYRHMSIGTDKPSADILSRFKFHLVDFVEPGERYTAFDFVDDCRRIINGLFERDKLPLICGGTGLYIRSLVEGIVEIPEDDLSIRSRLEDETIEKGPKYLYEKLLKLDPVEAKKIHPNNIKKIIRALEIYYLTGKTKTEILGKRRPTEEEYLFEVDCLMPPRDELYEKINARVELMIKSGLLDEVEKLIKMGLKEVIKGINVIGYNELFSYFDDEISLETAINLIKQNTRRFAKRQITWFNGMKNVKFYKSPGEILAHLNRFWV